MAKEKGYSQKDKLPRSGIRQTATRKKNVKDEERKIERRPRPGNKWRIEEGKSIRQRRKGGMPRRMYRRGRKEGDNTNPNGLYQNPMVGQRGPGLKRKSGRRARGGPTGRKRFDFGGSLSTWAGLGGRILVTRFETRKRSESSGDQRTGRGRNHKVT